MASDKGGVLRALHKPGDPFVLANAWDAGSARMLVALGARAIGTTSSGFAFTLGRPDTTVTQDEALTHAAEIVAAVPVPVSADLENGYGEAPETVAETVRFAFVAGLAGCSIEDVSGTGGEAYARDLAVERVRAGVAAARERGAALGRDFFFLARADGVLSGAYDLEEAIARIKAFEAAGADGVYVPMPGDATALSQVVAAVNVPVNALAAGPLSMLSREEFAALGVARISIGGALARMTQRVIRDAGAAMLGGGRFDSHPVISASEVDTLLASGAGG
jgi:2-methylisocitrate lyase-like PEP mutase family enzyme